MIKWPISFFCCYEKLCSCDSLEKTMAHQNFKFGLIALERLGLREKRKEGCGGGGSLRKIISAPTSILILQKCYKINSFLTIPVKQLI